MTPAAPFSVRTTSAFDRDFRKLAKRHQGIVDHYARVAMILENDPYNRSRAHDIKKLEASCPAQASIVSSSLASDSAMTSPVAS